MTSEAPAPGALRRHTFVIEQSDSERLDLAVARHLELSRTQAATLIAEKHVTVDGKHERASFRGAEGATVEVDSPPPPGRDVRAESIPINVVFEDEYLLVIDKAAGMVVHPAPGHWSGTLVNALMGRAGMNATGEVAERAGLVHRLDKDTSGLLVVAKTDLAHRRLSADLAARRIARRYAALSFGHLGEDHRRVDAPVGRDRRDRRKMAVDAGGRRAVTDFYRVARFDDADLLRAHLQTGRTHQIRVHLASIGHAVIGDETYGTPARIKGAAAPIRHFLHAAWLRFRHPITKAVLDLRSELPADLRPALAAAAKDPGLVERAEPLGHLGFFTVAERPKMTNAESSGPA